MKKKPEPKTIAHAMRWPIAIKLEIQAAAKQQGRSFSEFVRSAALAAARDQSGFRKKRQSTATDLPAGLAAWSDTR